MMRLDRSPTREVYDTCAAKTDSSAAIALTTDRTAARRFEGSLSDMASPVCPTRHARSRGCLTAQTRVKGCPI